MSKLYQPLTNREKQILRMWREGMRSKQIAKELCITKGVVKIHLSNVHKKYGCYDTHQAVLIDYVLQEYLGEP
jgi:DNA-binding CsgD family transcriptional regulator